MQVDLDHCHANNRILNKDLMKKYDECDALKAAIKTYHQSLRVVKQNPELLKSWGCNPEAAIHMQNMYHYRDEMFKLAGIEPDVGD